MRIRICSRLSIDFVRSLATLKMLFAFCLNTEIVSIHEKQDSYRCLKIHFLLQPTHKTLWQR